MGEWNYIRMTGKKGDSGAELMILYSSQNAVNPNQDPEPRQYWHQSFQSGDFYMCTKSADSTLWGNIMKIVGEGLTVQYSANGTSDWHSAPVLSTDKYMRQKMDSDSSWGAVQKIVGEDGADGQDGTNTWNSTASATTSTTSIAVSSIVNVPTGYSVKVGDLVIASGLLFYISAVGSTNLTVQYKQTIKGADGENAVVITALPSTPAGTFTGQIGNYNGTLYQWNGTSWVILDIVNASTLATAKDEAIATANANVATYTPRYIGAFASTSASGFPATTHKGDAYLNTTDSKLYIKGESTWTEQSAVNESNRNMFNLAMKDLLNLAGATGVVESYATAFIQNLFADKATINELQAMSVLFKEYCGSIMSQNPAIGDTMIYMGKNPRLSSVTREFQFAISEYLGKVGQQEMWSDKLITKILASGILALSVMGCVQTTDGVFSHFGETLEKTNLIEQNVKVVINARVGEYEGGVVSVNNNSSSFYMTNDWKNYNNIYTLNEEVVDCKKYKDFLYILTKTKLYKTNDMVNFSQVTNIQYQGVNFSGINKWVKHNLLIILTSGNKLYYSNNGENWFLLQGTNNFNYKLCITDDRVINLSSVITTTLEYYTYDGTTLNKSEINNPFKWSSLYAIPSMIQTNDNSYIFIAALLDEIGNILSAYVVSLNSELENKTLLFSTGQVSGMNVIGITGEYMLFTLKQNNTYVVFRRNLINSTTEVMAEIEGADLNGGSLNGSFGYMFFASNTWTKCYITNDGAESIKEIKLPDNTFIVQAIKVNDVVLYFCIISAGYDLYISRGREAGSGVVDEAFNSASSYIKVSDGLLMQWGQTENLGTAAVNSNKVVDVAFANLPNGKAYPDNSYSIQLTAEGSTSGLELAVTNKTKDGFTLRGYNRNGQTAISNVIFHWMTVGSA